MNILIVDDQKQVLEGIRSGIRWEDIAEIRNVFYAYTAMQAKHIFNNNSVDIIVSDIEMPGENGIQLIHWVRDHFPETRCIFLTAHANFDYAQNAIRLNCVDYILQPVKYDVLKKAVEKAIGQIIEERRDMEVMNHNTFWNTHKDELEKQTWYDYIRSNGDQSFLDKCANLKITLSRDENYTLFIAGLTLTKNSLDNWVSSEPLKQMADLADEFFSCIDSYHCIFGMNDRQFHMVFHSQLSEDEIYNITQTFIDMCHNNYELYPAIYLGHKAPFSSLPDIYPRLCALKSENVAAYSRLFTLSENLPPQCAALPSTQNWTEYFVNQTTDIIVSSLTDYIERSIAAGTLNSITLLTLQQYFTTAFHNSLQMRSIRFRSVMEQKEVFEAFTLSTRSVDDFMNFVQTIVAVNKSIAPDTAADQDNLVELAQSYIAANLSGDLSRQAIAGSIHVSDSYLSHLFQKQLGISLTDYIAAQKMALAKSLLVDTTMPVNFIAMKTGYNNVSYFIKSFKKEFGMTPAEYRKSRH